MPWSPHGFHKPRPYCCIYDKWDIKHIERSKDSCSRYTCETRRPTWATCRCRLCCPLRAAAGPEARGSVACTIQSYELLLNESWHCHKRKRWELIRLLVLVVHKHCRCRQLDRCLQLPWCHPGAETMSAQEYINIRWLPRNRPTDISLESRSLNSASTSPWSADDFWACCLQWRQSVNE